MIILILATDMARHAEILDNFKQKLDNFDYSSEDHLNTLKMILIKACDISNECRPIMVSEVNICNSNDLPISSTTGLGWMFDGRVLSAVWQGKERQFTRGSVHGQVKYLWENNFVENNHFICRDRVTKPIAQIGFIKYVLLPLFEALSKVERKNDHDEFRI